VSGGPASAAIANSVNAESVRKNVIAKENPPAAYSVVNRQRQTAAWAATIPT